MYKSFYHLHDKPFTLLPDPRFLYHSRKHAMALAQLEYGLESQAGFIVISGGIGTGKTTLIRYLLDHLGKEVTVGMITNTHSAIGELFEWISLAFELDYRGKDKATLSSQFIDFLVKEYAAGRHTVLVMDEAHNMSIDALEELRLISNINADKDQVLQIILVGQPELQQSLMRPELMQFAQRIAVSYHLEPLAAQETAEYIAHRLTVAGGDPGLFTPEACREIYRFSGGTPRLINTLCDTALVYGYASELTQIKPDLVQQVAHDKQSGGLFPKLDVVDTSPIVPVAVVAEPQSSPAARIPENAVPPSANEVPPPPVQEPLQPPAPSRDTAPPVEEREVSPVVAEAPPPVVAAPALAGAEPPSTTLRESDPPATRAAPPPVQKKLQPMLIQEKQPPEAESLPTARDVPPQAPPRKRPGDAVVKKMPVPAGKEVARSGEKNKEEPLFPGERINTARKGTGKSAGHVPAATPPRKRFWHPVYGIATIFLAGVVIAAYFLLGQVPVGQSAVDTQQSDASLRDSAQITVIPLVGKMPAITRLPDPGVAEQPGQEEQEEQKGQQEQEGQVEQEQSAPVQMVEPDEVAVPETLVVGATDSPGEIKSMPWIATLDSEGYTIQIASLTSENKAVEYIHHHGLEEWAAHYVMYIRGTEWHPVIYGSYPDTASASAAIGQLPGKVQADGPWVKSLGLIQRVMDWPG